MLLAQQTALNSGPLFLSELVNKMCINPDAVQRQPKSGRFSPSRRSLCIYRVKLKVQWVHFIACTNHICYNILYNIKPTAHFVSEFITVFLNFEIFSTTIAKN